MIESRRSGGGCGFDFDFVSLRFHLHLHHSCLTDVIRIFSAGCSPDEAPWVSGT